jgi:hypothetical protein
LAVETLEEQNRLCKAKREGLIKEKPRFFKNQGFRIGKGQQLGTAGSLRTTTGAAGAKVHVAVELETIHVKVHFDRFGSLHELFVHDVLKTVNIIRFVILVRLIQSHSQSRTASPAFVQKDTDRLHLFAFEILGNLLSGRFSYFQHDDVPPLKN